MKIRAQIKGDYKIKFRVNLLFTKVTLGYKTGKVDEHYDLDPKLGFVRRVDLPGSVDLLLELKDDMLTVKAVFGSAVVWSTTTCIKDLIPRKEISLPVEFNERGVKFDGTLSFFLV